MAEHDEGLERTCLKHGRLIVELGPLLHHHNPKKVMSKRKLAQFLDYESTSRTAFFLESKQNFEAFGLDEADVTPAAWVTLTESTNVSPAIYVPDTQSHIVHLPVSSSAQMQSRGLFPASVSPSVSPPFRLLSRQRSPVVLRLSKPVIDMGTSQQPRLPDSIPPSCEYNLLEQEECRKRAVEASIDTASLLDEAKIFSYKPFPSDRKRRVPQFRVRMPNEHPHVMVVQLRQPQHEQVFDKPVIRFCPTVGLEEEEGLERFKLGKKHRSRRNRTKRQGS